MYPVNVLNQVPTKSLPRLATIESIMPIKFGSNSFELAGSVKSLRKRKSKCLLSGSKIILLFSSVAMYMSSLSLNSSLVLPYKSWAAIFTFLY